METKSAPVIIYAESTPNPETMKFVANRYIIEPGKTAEYLHFTETKHAPMAEKLYEFGFVKSLFFSGNFITITKTPDRPWHSITQSLRTFIADYLNAGLPIIEIFPEPKKLETAAKPLPQSDAEKAIIDILEEYIKPAVEQDGGAITFKSFKEGVVTVALQGSCSGCPSSKITLKSGIENMLRRMVPGVNEVVAEDL